MTPPTVTDADREAGRAILSRAFDEETPFDLMGRAYAEGRAAGVQSEREACALLVEAQAVAGECADDTIAGVVRGQPWRNLAAAIRARAGGNDV